MGRRVNHGHGPEGDVVPGCEDGSVLLLTLGYALLALAVIFACVCATDLYIAQKRLDALSDAAALAGADGFTVVAGEGPVRAELTDDGVEEQASALVDALPGPEMLVAARTTASPRR